MNSSLMHGDSRVVLASLESDAIDACVCDPPYELGFMGKRWDATGIAFDPAFWREVLRVLKPGAHLLACGGTRTYHRMGVAIEDAGFEIRDCLAWLYGSGFPKSLNLGEGLGTALKPAYEPIVLARKPLKGTVAANVAQFGTGALNVDACRIGDEPVVSLKGLGDNRNMNDDGWKGIGKRPEPTTNFGRWPANVCIDPEAALVLDEQSGELTSGSGQRRPHEWQSVNAYGFSERPNGASDYERDGDSGGASRFFYVAKPSREERDLGCEGLTAKTAAELTNRKPGSAGLQNPRAGIRAGSADRDVAARKARNHHPTVKPVELMRWLVRLITPPDGVVLDPFMGSGTTGMACRYELRRFIGIEREPDYLAIAERRIAAVAPLFAVTSSEADAVDPQASHTGKRSTRGNLFSDGDAA